MQTLKLQLDDDIYEALKAKSIDIPAKINEYLSNLADDAYPSISTEDAKSRVSDAMNRYNDGTGTYIDEDNYTIHKNTLITNLKTKYADR